MLPYQATIHHSSNDLNIETVKLRIKCEKEKVNRWIAAVVVQKPGEVVHWGIKT